MTRVEMQKRIDWLEEHLGVNSTIDSRNFNLQCELCQLSVALAELDLATRTIGYDTYVPGRLPGDHGRVVLTTAE